MTSQHFFLAIAIVCLLLYIISLFVNHNFKLMYEGFDPTPTCQPVVNNFWWNTEAPKQIVSLITGVSFPVIAKNPLDAINSDFQIPFIQAGDVESSGCIAIDENTGTYTTKPCNNTDMVQLWTIVPIKNETDFKSIISQGKNRYSMLRDGDDTTITLPTGVKYGFFMVISKSKNGVFALASNGGNLTVQTVGNFTSQFWDITKDPGQASISVYDTHDLTRLGTNFINPLMPLNAQAGTIYETAGMQNKNKKAINLNFNISGSQLSSLLDGTTTSKQNSSSTVREGFEKKNCPACPSILTDYIAKNNIPCYGCNL